MTRRRPTPPPLPTDPPLPELAADAVHAVQDLFDEDDALDAFCAKSDVEKIRWRYLHADCDDFALALEVLHEGAWPRVAAQSSMGPLHRLNKSDSGRLVDASGYVTEDDLRRRYGQKKVQLVSDATDSSSLIDSDDELRRVFAAMLHLPNAPFADPEFRRKVALWMVVGHHFDPPPPRPRILPGSP